MILGVALWDSHGVKVAKLDLLALYTQTHSEALMHIDKIILQKADRKSPRPYAPANWLDALLALTKSVVIATHVHYKRHKRFEWVENCHRSQSRFTVLVYLRVHGTGNIE